MNKLTIDNLDSYLDVDKWMIITDNYRLNVRVMLDDKRGILTLEKNKRFYCHGGFYCAKDDLIYKIVGVDENANEIGELEFDSLEKLRTYLLIKIKECLTN